MRATISDTGDFIREAEVTTVNTKDGTFHLQFLSQLRSAKRSDEKHRNFSLILNRDELLILNKLIDAALMEV